MSLASLGHVDICKQYVQQMPRWSVCVRLAEPAAFHAARQHPGVGAQCTPPPRQNIGAVCRRLTVARGAPAAILALLRLNRDRLGRADLQGGRQEGACCTIFRVVCQAAPGTVAGGAQAPLPPGSPPTASQSLQAMQRSSPVS